MMRILRRYKVHYIPVKYAIKGQLHLEEHKNGFKSMSYPSDVTNKVRDT